MKNYAKDLRFYVALGVRHENKGNIFELIQYKKP